MLAMRWVTLSWSAVHCRRMGLKIVVDSSIVASDEMRDEQGKGKDDGFGRDGAAADRRDDDGDVGSRCRLLLSLEDTKDAARIRYCYRLKMVETSHG
ncbi:hypothetical protein ACLOJK_019501 [Asimina triloba]